MAVNSSGKGTMSSLFVSPLVLPGHLCWLGAQYMKLLTDCRLEVVVGIVFKPTPSKSSISSGLALIVQVCHHNTRSRAIGCASLQASLLDLRLEVQNHTNVFRWHFHEASGL